MRELKFRAFNIHLQEMQDVLQIDFVNKCVFVLPERNLEGGNQEEWSFDDIVLMQSSGLTDKKLKEIFERDIVDHDGEVYEVNFREGSFGIDIRIPPFSRKVYDRILFSTSWRVLGNALQHNDLLTTSTE